MTAPDIKYPYVGGVDWAFLRRMDIPDRHDPSKVYLRRLIIFKTPLCASYKHNIYTTDKDRHVHNHPMSFLSIVLRGGYTEKQKVHLVGSNFLTKTRVRKLFSFALTRKGEFHQITSVIDPTTTLLFCGRRSQDWGFLMEDGTIMNWREYTDG